MIPHFYWDWQSLFLQGANGLRFPLLLCLCCLLFLPGIADAETVEDEFNLVSYSNNDGSQNWASDWQEIGESTNPSSGQVRVMTDGSNSYVLRIRQTRGAERQANLSGATAATFNFNYRRSSLDDSSEYVAVEVSSDGGGSWVELDRFSGPSNDSSYRSASYDITAYATADTHIRFNGSSGMDSNDRVYFDNVEIDYSQPSVPQLIAHYALEGNASDGSGNNHDGGAQGTVTYSRGKVCDGVQLDGSGYLQVPAHADFTIAEELTVMAWLRPDSLSVPGHDSLYTFLSKDTNYEVHIRNNGAIFWWWGAGSISTPSGLVQEGVWQHVAFVYSRSAGAMQIYLDGSVVASQSYNGSLPSNNLDFYIGTDWGGSSGTDFTSRRFYGGIDEVEVYSEALSAAQVISQMNAADPCSLPTPLAEWRFDECNYTAAGALAVDAQGNHDAAAQGGVASEPSGVVGRAAELDQSSESFTTGNDVPMNSDWTVSTWFRMPFGVSEGSRYHVLGAMNGGNDLLWLDSLDSFRWGGYANSNTVNGSFQFNTLADGWHHLLLVGEAGATSLYIDSIYQDQIALQAQGNLHFVGTSYDSYLGEQGFRAPLDEFIVFGEVLDQQQIDSLYSLQLQGRNLDGSARADIFCGTTVDHFELIHDSSALTCAPEEVTVRACANADCSSIYTDPVTITLSPGGWIGGNEQTINNGSGMFRLRHTTPGIVSLAVTGNPVEDQPQQCIDGSGNASCDLVFHETGFLFEIPNHRSCTTPEGITITAVRADASAEHCIANLSFSDTTRSINFWSEYQLPDSGSELLIVNGTSVSETSPGTAVEISFDDQASSALNIQYNDAGQVQLSAYFAGSGDEAGLVMVGSDSFVVAPYQLQVIATSDGTTPLDNASSSGDPRWAAGEDFFLEVAGVCSDGLITPNFAASTSLSAVTPFAPATGTLGALIGGPLTAADYVSGVALVNDVSYSEVGTLTIGAEVLNYLGSNLDVVGSSDSVGRFTPHHFLTNLNTPQFASGCGSGSFTYLGQPFDYVTTPVIIVTAQNLQNGDTQNYAGDWWKLSSSTLSGKTYSAAIGSVDTSQLPASDPIVTDLGGGMGLLTFSAGSGLKMDRGDPTAPFDADISLEINVLDGDGIAASVNPVRFGAATAGNGISFDNGKEMRWGRMILNNAYGSELLALAMPLRAEYFNGTAFVRNGGDSCTSLPLSQLTLNNGSATGTAENPISVGSGTTSASLLEPFLAGDANLSFSAAGDDGYVDVTADLSLLEWLRYDWNGDGNHDDNPLGRATFGLYKGQPNLIYLRETYR